MVKTDCNLLIKRHAKLFSSAPKNASKVVKKIKIFSKLSKIEEDVTSKN